MKKLIILLFLLTKLHAAKSQNASYWQQQVDYKIDVSLDDITHSLDGFLKMVYHNNSPDTLRFIWIHLWPNAFKNDRTAFSDQLLENGRTDFYFSDNDQRGYINRLDFKVNGTSATLQDHPQHQDIAKLLLPAALPPKGSIQVQTPFHVQLPYNFSRGGHVGQSYQISQWYPKPAVYDRKGWHPLPYLDQGEFYSEFGNYEVQITLPENYLVAATGELQDEAEKTWLTEKATGTLNYTNNPPQKKGLPKGNKSIGDKYPASSTTLKTIHYSQERAHDFAWFADKRFAVRQDTLMLPSNRIISVSAFFINAPESNNLWKNSIRYIKDAVLTRSAWLGQYPYNTVTAVEAKMGFTGGMEYPTITALSSLKTEKDLEGTIEHEVGHNWNYGILASNERQHPWLDEGINSYYDQRYKSSKTITTENHSSFFGSRVPDDMTAKMLQIITSLKKDQPIETPSEQFAAFNYGLIAYFKTSQWMQSLEKYLGTPMFDSCMHEFYRRWQSKHPYPEDFLQVITTVSGQNIDSLTGLLTKKGSLVDKPIHRPPRFSTFFNLKETERYRYILASPALGYNTYDKLMIGAMLHNYTLPAEKFQFILVPMYATGSARLNGLGRMSYSWLPGNKGHKVELALAAASFSADSFTDSTKSTTYLRFSKLVPSLKLVFPNDDPRSTVNRFLQWKTFFIREQSLLFTRDTIVPQDIISYPTSGRYLNQLRFVFENNRVLYPFRTETVLEQGAGFARISFTGNYFFNYAKSGGMNLRFFAGKFFYLGEKTYLKQFETDRYHLNMTGPKGYEDYTYSNYYTGRNEFEGFSSQQIMERDGFFKVRSDLLSSKIGKTDDWLVAANFTTDIPKSINPLQVLPIKIPLKVFVDLGTYADAWDKNSNTGKIIYDAGLQLSLLSNTVNVYFPLLYSKVYRDYFKSTITEKRFAKNISFSIDIQRITARKLIPQIPL